MLLWRFYASWATFKASLSLCTGPVLWAVLSYFYGSQKRCGHQNAGTRTQSRSKLILLPQSWQCQRCRMQSRSKLIKANSVIPQSWRCQRRWTAWEPQPGRGTRWALCCLWGSEQPLSCVCVWVCVCVFVCVCKRARLYVCVYIWSNTSLYQHHNMLLAARGVLINDQHHRW
jgi:hypothetical protein